MELSKFVIDETCCMMAEEMTEDEVYRTALSLPLILSDIAQPGVLLLFYFLLLVDIRQHH